MFENATSAADSGDLTIPSVSCRQCVEYLHNGMIQLEPSNEGHPLPVPQLVWCNQIGASNL